MSDTVFTVFIPDGAELQSQDLLNMGVYAIFKGTESYSVPGGTEFRFNQLGISKISTVQLGALIQFGALGVACLGQIGPRFIELADAEYNGLVPAQFPESSKTEGEGEESVTSQMTFAEYCPFGPVQSNDKTKWLINISERAQGETCGDGTSWGEYLVWSSMFGDRILSQSHYEELINSIGYKNV